jgi:hypothetical protein
MIMGFSSLKNSSTFNEIARKGANMLFVAMILLLVAYALAFIIPRILMFGEVIKIILCVVAYIMVFLGWSKIKNAVTA